LRGRPNCIRSLVKWKLRQGVFPGQPEAVYDCAFLKQQARKTLQGHSTLMVPKQIFFTTGTGRHKERQQSFEAALRNAGLDAHQLVRVTATLPPACEWLARKEGLKLLGPGQQVFAVVAEKSTCEPHRLLAASVGVAIPADPAVQGVVMDHHSFGQTHDQAGELAEELAVTQLALRQNVAFEPDVAWDEKKGLYRLGETLVRTSHATEAAVGDKNGQWTTVLAVAILLDDQG